ncbi:hypothetical protein N879_04460 [Alcaligenes sp. EGD-AK7]|uniref:hypothetical protein n=1 Tax=Alcaligenes sp. EGD-AK7 TaxID=1386079 RepID=UPI000396B904|nr:hypothetical protein [Alcaligenes sp. EGD-AK7]ERI34781.1 hypothetical protein N879_04460 [Alcaligenes sp. EGD-AK7]
MASLSYEERKRLRRAAEDARDACNRHFGPFVDVVAHPLNILALLDMVDPVDQQQKTLANIEAFVACDASAISYLSLGEYRTALLKMLREAPAAKEPGA